jgi:hypothetical protein
MWLQTLRRRASRLGQHETPLCTSGGAVAQPVVSIRNPSLPNPDIKHHLNHNIQHLQSHQVSLVSQYHRCIINRLNLRSTMTTTTRITTLQHSHLSPSPTLGDAFPSAFLESPPCTVVKLRQALRIIGGDSTIASSIIKTKSIRILTPHGLAASTRRTFHNTYARTASFMGTIGCFSSSHWTGAAQIRLCGICLV